MRVASGVDGCRDCPEFFGCPVRYRAAKMLSAGNGRVFSQYGVAGLWVPQPDRFEGLSRVLWNSKRVFEIYQDQAQSNVSM